MASWLEEPDTPATYDGHYEPILIEGDRAVTNGRNLYFEQDGSTLKAEFRELLRRHIAERENAFPVIPLAKKRDP